MRAIAIALVSFATLVVSGQVEVPPDEPIASDEKAQHVSLFLSSAHTDREGFLRVINRSKEQSVVEIYAFDDTGESFGPVELELEGASAGHLSSDDVERGNAAKGLSDGVGTGMGDWRLKLVSNADIEALSFVLTDDGFLNNLDGAVSLKDGGSCQIDFFNPASNRDQISMLRLTNAGEETAKVEVAGTDDLGQAAPIGSATATLVAGESRAFTATDLELGSADLSGRLGHGYGKWRLKVSSDQPVEVTNLLAGRGGNLAVPDTCESMEKDTKPGGDVMFLDDLPADASRWGTDSYELVSAEIDGDSLKATVSYGGGCRDHKFALILDNAVMMTDPVRLVVSIAHYGNEDPCEAYLTDDIAFDLTTVKKLVAGDSKEGGSAILILTQEDGTETELQYDF